MNSPLAALFIKEISPWRTLLSVLGNRPYFIALKCHFLKIAHYNLDRSSPVLRRTGLNCIGIAEFFFKLCSIPLTYSWDKIYPSQHAWVDTFPGNEIWAHPTVQYILPNYRLFLMNCELQEELTVIHGKISAMMAAYRNDLPPVNIEHALSQVSLHKYLVLILNNYT